MFPKLRKAFTWAEYWGQVAVWWGSWPPFWCIHSLFYRSYFILFTLRWQFWLREAIFPALLPYYSRVTSRVTNYDNLCKVTTSHLSCHRQEKIYILHLTKMITSKFLRQKFHAFRWKINYSPSFFYDVKHPVKAKSDHLRNYIKSEVFRTFRKFKNACPIWPRLKGRPLHTTCSFGTKNCLKSYNLSFVFLSWEFC